MFGWYRELSGREKNTLWACFAGWGLDGMDVQIYSFLIPTLTTLWAMTAGEAGLIATATLLMSAAGGWIAGILADRWGRVRVLQITVLWFALFTGLSGLTNSWEELLVVRALQGLGFGGEWAAGSVLIGEVVRARHRGKAVGLVQSGWAPGWALAALVSGMALAWLPADIAWRIVFFVGVTPAALVFFLRRYIPEPDIHLAARARPHTRGEFLAIFSPALLRTTVLCSLLSAGAQGGYYAITTWLPTFLRDERGLTVFGSTGYLMVVIAGSFAGYLASAWLADTIGRRRNFLVFAILSVATAWLYTNIPIGDAAMLVLGFPLGFFASGIFSGMGPFFTELFPTRLRGSGQGFAYNFGRGLGALVPAFVGFLAAQMPLGEAIGLFALGAYGLLVAAALLLPETRGRELAAN